MCIWRYKHVWGKLENNLLAIPEKKQLHVFADIYLHANCVYCTLNQYKKHAFLKHKLASKL